MSSELEKMWKQMQGIEEETEKMGVGGGVFCFIAMIIAVMLLVAFFGGSIL